MREQRDGSGTQEAATPQITDPVALPLPQHHPADVPTLLGFFYGCVPTFLIPSAAPFRHRNPRTADTPTSPHAPAAVGASLAGLALGIYPAQQLRYSVAIYALFRALEFGWTRAEDNGMIWAG